MNADFEAVQTLQAYMRDEFLSDLPEYCQRIDESILALEHNPEDRKAYQDLYCNVHALKGLGGTHGLKIVTTLCHQFENYLTETDAQHGFGEVFTTRALTYVDLLRRIEGGTDGDGTEIETALEDLRLANLKDRTPILIAESSAMMARIYQQALLELPLQLAVVDNGLTALERLLHEPFGLLIVGRELKELDGVAVLAAIRTARVRNRDIPAILISSRNDTLPDYVTFQAVIARDQQMTDQLYAKVRGLLVG